jgi:hypothetical protein
MSTITLRTNGRGSNSRYPASSVEPIAEYIVGFPSSEIPLAAGARRLPCRRCGAESWYNPPGLRRIQEANGIPLCGPCGFLFQQLHPAIEAEWLPVAANFESERRDRLVISFTEPIHRQLLDNVLGRPGAYGFKCCVLCSQRAVAISAFMVAEGFIQPVGDPGPQRWAAVFSLCEGCAAREAQLEEAARKILFEHRRREAL